jgi:rare lipoprotein A
VTRRGLWLLLLLAPLAGCGRAPPPVAAPHYVLENAWRSPAGVWFYPRQSFSYDETGLASVIGADHPALTTDGEAYDPQAMSAASQTLQLPAIARVTNLETGRQVVVRVNDRGPASPARLIALSPTAARLLGIAPGGTAQVRVQVESGPSQALVQALAGPSARLGITAAPVTAVTAEALAPPPGITAAPGSDALPPSAAPAGPSFDLALPPLRLPVTATQGPAAPGRLYVRGDTFQTRAYAEAQRRALAGIGAAGMGAAGMEAMVVPQGAGRGQSYEVLAGPFPDVAAAEAALQSALGAGVADARIVVQ